MSYEKYKAMKNDLSKSFTVPYFYNLFSSLPTFFSSLSYGLLHSLPGENGEQSPMKSFRPLLKRRNGMAGKRHQQQRPHKLGKTKDYMGK
ncbi:hypothetical protein CEXT_776691 [Caerostris extrusa]|uniref:Uncharacterized protein n=1 Tax=Caerostris extrusa TaxID=172846 RepID=A0AAV4WFD8_CAEEX|nr:hypothetical protein CEXT_776691 [Caerostris extrusa]